MNKIYCTCASWRFFSIWFDECRVFSSFPPTCILISVGKAPTRSCFRRGTKFSDAATLDDNAPSKLSGVKWSSHTTLLLLLTKVSILSLSFLSKSIHFLHKARLLLDFLGSGIWKKLLPLFPCLFLQFIAWHCGIFLSTLHAKHEDWAKQLFYTIFHFIRFDNRI